jgi:hypothetical protein
LDPSDNKVAGNCDNPTPLQFTRAFRKFFFNNYLLPMGTGNCTPDLDSILVHNKAVKNSKTAKIDSNVASKEEKENSSVQLMLFHKIQDVDYKSSTIEENLISNNATTYVCGYLLRCLEKHNCQTCSSALIKNELDSTDKLLCYFKAYETSRQPFGGLTVPDDGLIQYILKAEQIFIEVFPTFISKPGIAKQLVSMIPQFQVKEYKQFPSQFLVELFVRMRLHYILKFGNRDIIQGKKKGKTRNTSKCLICKVCYAHRFCVGHGLFAINWKPIFVDIFCCKCSGVNCRFIATRHYIDNVITQYFTRSQKQHAVY